LSGAPPGGRRREPEPGRVQVTTLPVSIDLSGDSASPLGNLTCTILATLNNVVGVVGLLNQLLGVGPGSSAGSSPDAKSTATATARGHLSGLGPPCLAESFEVEARPFRETW